MSGIKKIQRIEIEGKCSIMEMEYNDIRYNTFHPLASVRFSEQFFNVYKQSMNIF